VGRGADVHRGVELSGRVEIGDRCVIDDGAHVTNSVVMPGTYVGRGVRLHNAIASGPWLYRVDLDDTQHVEDALLLAGSRPRVAA
jgi:NDP-sugar pyrophosphorylase family protein